MTTQFALKIPSLVDKHGRSIDADINKIKGEAIHWAMATHPGHVNVVPIIEAKDLQLLDLVGQPVAEHTGLFFTIVTEFCAEGSLSDWLKRLGGRAPSVSVALSIARGFA